MSECNVILLVLDSLRADYMNPNSNDSSTTQNIQEIIQDGTYLNNVYSTGSWTVPAHGSLFSGKLPSETGIGGPNRYFKTDGQSLAEIVTSNGYETLGISANPWITSDFGFDQGFQYFESQFPDPPFASKDPRNQIRKLKSNSEKENEWWELAKWILSSNQMARLGNSIHRFFTDEMPYIESDKITDITIDKINKIKSPFFVFVNYMDAHEPYTDESSLQEEINWNLESISSPPISIPNRRIRDIYAKDVQFLDKQIGLFIDHLKQEDLYHDSMLIILSDHGQALGEHQYWGHGTFLYQPLVNIPVAIKMPAGKSPVQHPSQPISIIDIFNFICDTTGGDTSDRLDGYDRNYVIAESFGPHESKEVNKVSESGYRAIATNDYYGIINIESKAIEHCIPDNPKTKRALEKIIQTNKDLKQEFTNKSRRSLVNESVEERLEQLGYK